MNPIYICFWNKILQFSDSQRLLRAFLWFASLHSENSEEQPSATAVKWSASEPQRSMFQLRIEAPLIWHRRTSQIWSDSNKQNSHFKWWNCTFFLLFFIFRVEYVTVFLLFSRCCYKEVNSGLLIQYHLIKVFHLFFSFGFNAPKLWLLKLYILSFCALIYSVLILEA